MSPADEAASILQQFGMDASNGELASHSPIDGQEIGRVVLGDPARACERSAQAFPTGVVPRDARGSWSDCSARSCARRRSRSLAL